MSVRQGFFFHFSLLLWKNLYVPIVTFFFFCTCETTFFLILPLSFFCASLCHTVFSFVSYLFVQRCIFINHLHQGFMHEFECITTTYRLLFLSSKSWQVRYSLIDSSFDQTLKRIFYFRINVINWFKSFCLKFMHDLLLWNLETKKLSGFSGFIRF